MQVGLSAQQEIERIMIMKKDLVKEKVKWQDVQRHCEERSDEAIHLPPHPVAALLPSQLCKQGHKARKLACSLCSARRSIRRGEGACSNNSGTLQGLLNVNHFTHLTHFTHLRKRAAFTLAEVLITLGVIGIVAAMTIPNLVQSYKKKVVETRMLQFYSMMNQAVKLSEIDNGEQTFWVSRNGDLLTAYSIEEFFNKYFAPYLRYNKIDPIDDTKIAVYFANGSAMTMSNLNKISSPHINFYPFGQIKDDSVTGKDCFYFVQTITASGLLNVLYTKGIQPYSWRPNGWEGLSDEEIDKILREDTGNGCNNLQNYRGFCAAVIMRNGWKIPEDYPFKF